MSGDWIKVRSDVHEDPAVAKICAALNLDRYAVVGRLVKAWAWADAQTIDGNADVTLAYIDEITSTPGMGDAMVLVKWLEVPERGRVRFPKFDRHNGKSAKKRALGSKRQQAFRSNAPVTQPSRSSVTREEKSIRPTNTALPVANSTPPPPPKAAPAEPQVNPDAQARIIAECTRAQLENPTAENPIVARWIRNGATPTQITNALIEARKAIHPPAELTAAYVDPIVDRITTQDRRSQALAAARVQRTQDTIAEQRKAAETAAPMPLNVFESLPATLKRAVGHKDT